MKQQVSKKDVRVNFDKKCRLDKLCGDGGLRPALEYMYFQNGYVYATNSTILVRANLHAISNLPQTTIDALNGHYFHKDLYYDLINRDTFEVTKDNEIQSYVYELVRVLDSEEPKLERCEDSGFYFNDRDLNNDTWGGNIVNTFNRFYALPTTNVQTFSFANKLLTLLFQTIGYKGDLIYTALEDNKYLVHTEDLDDIVAILCPKVVSDTNLEIIAKRK